MNSSEAVEFKAELKDHPELELELENIQATQKALDNLNEIPNPGIVKSLLAYSASLQIHKIPSRGIVLDIVKN
jgi:hypothetical protein